MKAGSEKEVNIDAPIRKKIVAAMNKNEIKKFMFAQGQKEVGDGGR